MRKEEKQSSNFVGVSLAICLLGIGIYLFTANVQFLVVAAFGFTMMVPFGSMFSGGKHQLKLILYTAVMSLLGVLAIVQAFKNGETFNIYTSFFLIGFIAFQWIANYLRIKESNV